ncbi:hypothetical protein [Legionella cardiaca]|uniref:Ankyrin repeats (3 copies) n=1 Tax=Legionella cardiaca TaxID=1071983 RepID=A0ABY8ATS8_9GAMM|nr:hypothetical protein [Legionella cardiaca]WED43844.1 hypothetical protein PXX05_03420 [Legionella cardiaca]
MTDLFKDKITAQEIREILTKEPQKREEIKDNQTPIQKFAQGKQWDLVEVFAEFPVNATEEDKARYGSALLTAVQADQFDLAKKLITAGASVGYFFSDSGENLLHTLLKKKGPNELLKQIIDKAYATTLKRRNKEGDSPILLAAKSNNWEIVSALATKLGKETLEDNLQYAEAAKLAETANQNEIVGLLKGLQTPTLETMTPDDLRKLLQGTLDIREQKLSSGSSLIEKAASLKRWDLVAVFAEFPVTLSQESQAKYGSALLDAVNADQFEVAKKLLDAGASTGYYFSGSENGLLHILINKGQDELLEQVIQKTGESTLVRRNKEGVAPILLAAKSNNWKAVGCLAKKLGKTDINDHLQYQEIRQLAAEAKQDETVQLLQPTHTWETVTPEDLRKLLQGKLSIREAKLSDGSPIQKAVQLKRWDLVAVFAEFPVDPKQEELAKYGSALLNAANNDQFDVAKKLLTAQASTGYYYTNTGNTLLHVLLSKAEQADLFADVVRKIDGVSLEQRNKEGNSPILLAAKSARWDAVLCLAAKLGKIDITVLNSDKKQYKEVLALAFQGNQDDLADRLISYDSLQQMNEEGLTPLANAVKNNNAPLVNQMLSYEIFNPDYYDSQKDIAGCTRAYLLTKEQPDVCTAENMVRLKTIADKHLFAEFQKVYESLYAAQSSLFKQKKNTCQNWDDVLKYAKQNPHSRSAKAVELTLKFIETNDKSALVKAVHQYGYEHSSSFGLFKRSNNKQGLENNFENTYKNADENSRTGAIRSILN